MSSEPPWVQTAASDDRAAAQEREAVGVNGLQDVLGGDGRGVCTHPHSLGDLLAEAYARGHGLGESGGDGSLRTIPLVRRAAEQSLGKTRSPRPRLGWLGWLGGWLGCWLWVLFAVGRRLKSGLLGRTAAMISASAPLDLAPGLNIDT